MNFSLENLRLECTAPEVCKQFDAYDSKDFLVIGQNECDAQRHAWAVVN